MRDLTQAIIPALARADDKPVLRSTIFDHAQAIGCASEKKARVRKLWWKMKEIAVKSLPLEVISS